MYPTDVEGSKSSFSMSWFKPALFLQAFLLIYAFLDFFPFTPQIILPSYIALIGVGLAFMLANPNYKVVDRVNFAPLLFIGLWFVYTCIGLFWAKDKDAVVTYSMYIMRYGITFAIFSAAFRKKSYQDRMPLFFLAVLIIYAITAIYELLTWNHLPSSRFPAQSIWLPTGPFYGENHLAAFFILLMPFAAFLPMYYKRKSLYVVAVILMLFTLVLVTIQGARIAMIAVIAFILYYFLVHISLKAKLISTAAILLLTIFVISRFPEPVDIFMGLFKYHSTTVKSETGTMHMSSVQIRKQLINESVDIALQSKLLGVGGGNFEYEMRSERLSRTARIENAHNYLMEILGNSGIIFFLWFCYFLGFWLIRLYKQYKIAQGKEKYLYLMYFWSVAMFLPASILPSTIRWYYMYWIVLSGANAMCFRTITPIENSG